MTRILLKSVGALTAGVGAVTWKVSDHALVASLLGGGGACCRGGTFASVVWGTGGFLCRVTLVYMPGKQIAPGKLVSTVLALVGSIAGVCGGVRVWRGSRGARELTRSHVSRYMLRTGEGCVADGAFVIASHSKRRKRRKRKRKRRWTSVVT